MTTNVDVDFVFVVIKGILDVGCGPFGFPLNELVMLSDISQVMVKLFSAH